MNLSISKIVKEKPPLADVAEFVFRHLLKQRVRSIRQEDGYCVYHGPDGMSCAVGCLIPRTTNTTAVEGLKLEDAFEKLYSLRTRKALCRGVPDDRQNYLLALDCLQHVHDSLQIGVFTKKHFRSALHQFFGDIKKEVKTQMMPSFTLALSRIDARRP